LGGAHKPKHLGQSGHPMPLPVARTSPPKKNNKKTDEQVNKPIRLYNFNIISLLRCINGSNRTHA
jgi:hypothetical protein